MTTLTRAGLVVAGAALVAIAALALLGYRTVVISSGSMTPALHVGDVVLSRSERPDQLRTGDVVTFRDPDLGDRTVTHRVVRVEAGDAGPFTVATRGDANSVGETWRIAPDERVGLAVGSLRYAGWWFLLLHAVIGSPAGRVALVLLVCAWAGFESLGRVWSRP